MKSNEFIEKNPELFNKAQNCKSLDEFLNLAKENNIEFEDINLEEAYNLLNGKQEINDDLLDNVAGGKGKKKDKLTRVKNKNEAAAFEATGYDVYEQYGEPFVNLNKDKG